MTSPTDPTKQPLTERISQRVSFGRSNRLQDPEERFTRNVTLAFVAVIVFVAVVVVVGLAYGFYDQNLKPLANVAGTSIGRGEYDDRVALEELRLDRAEAGVRAGLRDGSVNEDLANRRLTAIRSELAAVQTAAMENLVDLTYQGKLAAQEGVTLAPDELAAALAADGTSGAARRISALIILSPEAEFGLAATPQGHAEALVRAEEARAALESGTPFAEVAAEYSPATASVDGDLGYFEQDEIPDPVWAAAIFALDQGGITETITGENGELLIGTVTDIIPARPDPGFLAAADEAIGKDVHSRNVELEALAAKLDEKVTTDALGRDYDQVQLAEILISGDTTVDPEIDEGSIRASHILYAPGEPGAAPPEDDPAWAEAEAEAERAAGQLRVVKDPEVRATAFAARARLQGSDSTRENGGDLGYFERAAMVPEFADALFDAPDLAYGDIVGPVRTEFGWHVIMFADRKAPLAERLAAVEAALAADGADFASLAAQYSDGPEALQGGRTGWHVVDDLDDLTAIALAATEVGATTQPVDGDLGYYIYLKEDEAVQPLDAAAATRLEQRAFDDWYQELRFSAEDDGLITIDQSFFEVPVQQQDVPAQGPGG